MGRSPRVHDRYRSFRDGGGNIPILLEVINIGTQCDDKNNNVNRSLQPRSKPKRGDNS